MRVLQLDRNILQQYKYRVFKNMLIANIQMEETKLENFVEIIL